MPILRRGNLLAGANAGDVVGRESWSLIRQTTLLLVEFAPAMRKPKIKSRSAKPSSNVLGIKTFAAISAVEGLKLSAAGRKRISQPLSAERRRANVIKAYSDLKNRG
jgi:hypothetical protein